MHRYGAGVQGKVTLKQFSNFRDERFASLDYNNDGELSRDKCGVGIDVKRDVEKSSVASIGIITALVTATVHHDAVIADLMNQSAVSNRC